MVAAAPDARSCAAPESRASCPKGATTRHGSGWRDEWQLATRIWRKRRSEPEREREREIISKQRHPVADYLLRSKRAVTEFLDRLEGLDLDVFCVSPIAYLRLIDGVSRNAG